MGRDESLLIKRHPETGCPHALYQGYQLTQSPSPNARVVLRVVKKNHCLSLCLPCGFPPCKETQNSTVLNCAACSVILLLSWTKGRSVMVVPGTSAAHCFHCGVLKPGIVSSLSFRSQNHHHLSCNWYFKNSYFITKTEILVSFMRRTTHKLPNVCSIA